MDRIQADVEHVMQWACGELARRRPTTLTSSLGPLPVPRGDALLLGRWITPPSFPKMHPMFRVVQATLSAAPGSPPHPDSLVVEAAIRGLTLGADDFEAGELAHGLGFERLDARGAFASAAGNATALLLAFGALGKRPDSGSPWPIPSPKMATNGRPGIWREQVEIDDAFGERRVEVAREIPCQRIRNNLYPNGSYCRLDWCPEPKFIVADRAEYWAWRVALERLATALAGKLERFEPMASEAAARPWLDEIDGPQDARLFTSRGGDPVQRGARLKRATRA